jgi:D-beta-D-heptose 7-phosphate kinase/D-beta-D-heptose 1-phosphate adenosyltransferase
VLVVGDVMLDRDLLGRAERVSPEAPVPVVLLEGEALHLGGAANVAHNAARLGAEVVLLGVRGDDPEGAQLLALADLPHLKARLLTDPLRPTTVKTRVFAGRSQQVFRLDRESRASLPDILEEALLQEAELLLPGVAAVVLSDYCKGTLTQGLLRRLIDRCREGGKPVLVDPKRSDFSAYRAATLLTPNLHEAARALGVEELPAGDDEATEAAGRLRQSAGADAVLLTRGARGMTLVTAEGARHFPARAREVADVTGAGDTVIAMLAVALAEGLPLQEAALRANVAAGLKVGRVGTQVVDRAEVEALLQSARPAGKVLTRDELLARAHLWREEGKVVAFTNGCFDLVHAGHIRCLQEARRHGDVLVVALNGDASVARLKGPGRPVVPERQRAELLAALECVDAVVIFDEDTPRELVEALRPQVMVKGGDYRVEDIAGADCVLRGGGRVVIYPLQEGLSTSRLLAGANGDVRGGPERDGAKTA